MKKIIATIFVLTVLLAFASAFSVIPTDEEGDTSNYAMDNFIGRIISSLKGTGLFATTNVFEEYLNCGKSVALEPKILRNTLLGTKSVKVTATSDEAVYAYLYYGKPDGNKQLASTQYLGKGGILSVTFTCDAGAYWDNYCYVVVYNCDLPCGGDSSCSSTQICDTSFIGMWLPGFGVCKEVGPCDENYCDDGEADTEDVCVLEGGNRVCYYYAEVPEAPAETETCTNSCTQAGKKVCSGDGYKVCGNYDSDSCLEYGPVISCPNGQSCSNGVCSVITTTPTCGDGICNGNELCDSCPEDCGECSSSCINRNTNADTDCNGQVSQAERNSYIGKWKNSEITRDELGIVLEAWSNE
jgi:hypothetical protein